MKPLRLFLIVGLAALVAYAIWYAIDSPLRLTTEEARRRLAAKEVDVVLDVRTPLERKTLGVYPGSLAIPAGDVEQELPRRVPNKEARILIYCNTGQRARAAAEKLQGLGYKNARYYAGSHVMLL